MLIFLYFSVFDRLGSSNVMTDWQGSIVQHYGYTAFGKERYTQETQAFKVTNRYTSQQIDEDTGLYFYGSRYYDPELGRFIQPDCLTARYNLGLVLYRAGRPNEAIPHVRYCLSKEPNNQTAQGILANLLKQTEAPAQDSNSSETVVSRLQN